MGEQQLPCKHRASGSTPDNGSGEFNGLKLTSKVKGNVPIGQRCRFCMGLEPTSSKTAAHIHVRSLIEKSGVSLKHTG